MTFKYSRRSQAHMQGLKEPLIRVLHRVIQITPVDIGVNEGLRTVSRQQELVRNGASQTMRSRHLTGHAVDLVAYINGQVAWDWPLYYQIANAMRQAARAEDVKLTWGGIWDTPLNQVQGDIEDRVSDYVARRRAMNKKAFLDGPHYELTWGDYPS